MIDIKPCYTSPVFEDLKVTTNVNVFLIFCSFNLKLTLCRLCCKNKF